MGEKGGFEHWIPAKGRKGEKKKKTAPASEDKQEEGDPASASNGTKASKKSGKRKAEEGLEVPAGTKEAPAKTARNSGRGASTSTQKGAQPAKSDSTASGRAEAKAPGRSKATPTSAATDRSGADADEGLRRSSRTKRGVCSHFLIDAETLSMDVMRDFVNNCPASLCQISVL